MLKKILIISVILAASENFYAQAAISENLSHLVCKYQVKFLSDSTNISTEKSELMTLLIGSHESLYKSDQKAVSDSLSRAIVKKTLGNITPSNTSNITIDFSKVPKVNLKHEVLYKNDEIIIYDNVFKYQFSFPAVNRPKWILSEETKMIGEYLCHKATGEYNGRKLIAWYTKTIPIPEGPYAFKGLPGLIIAMHDISNSYSFILVYLKKEKREINPMQNATHTTYEKFVNARRDFKDNAANNVQSLLRRDMTDQEKDLVKRNASKPHNYLD